tara:strand:- start:202 stop:414 length:213 start_codon:yes stop_codon:yes gene_type:complete
MNQLELNLDNLRNKFTNEELTELEEITRRSVATWIENSGDTRGEEALKAWTREKLLKGIHLKVQSMCIRT